MIQIVSNYRYGRKGIPPIYGLDGKCPGGKLISIYTIGGI